jgi:hypothetical protein
MPKPIVENSRAAGSRVLLNIAVILSFWNPKKTDPLASKAFD